MDYGMWNDRTNMSMLTDFYELTMANGYVEVVHLSLMSLLR